MSHSFSCLIYHLIFTPKERRSCLDDRISEQLYKWIRQLVREQRGIPVAVNGMPDHIHLLVRLRPSQALSTVLQRLKSRTSFWLERDFPELGGFVWQAGYGAITVSMSMEDAVKSYIENQKAHHAKRTYLDEFRALLKAHGYDPALADGETLATQCAPRITPGRSEKVLFKERLHPGLPNTRLLDSIEQNRCRQAAILTGKDLRSGVRQDGVYGSPG